MSQDTTAVSTSCRLQRLPNELRNRIFAFAVIKDGATLITRKTTTRKTHVLQPSPPPLAYTCRQFYDEVLPVFYGNNTFVAYLPPQRSRHDPRVSHDMSRWLEEAEACTTILRKGQGLSHSVIKHIKLAFLYFPHQHADNKERNFSSLIVSQGKGGLEIEPSGILQGRCICIPRKIIAAQTNKLLELVTALEEHCAEYLLYSKLTWGQDEEHCEICGSIRTVPAGTRIE